MSTPAPPPHPHLTDPILTPFLAPTFSLASYLNNTLPALSPPSTLPSRRTPPATAASLDTLSNQTTTLLSTLSLHTTRLLNTLHTLTDELLRVTPRLGYEVELLRADVGALGHDVQECGAALQAVRAPEQVARLQMLGRVRERLEEVVRVFGEAMGEVGTAGVEAAVAEGDVERGRVELERLRGLAVVFRGTVREAEVRAVVERGEALVREVGGEEERGEGAGEGAAERKEEGGVYGLIEQLRGLGKNI